MGRPRKTRLPPDHNDKATWYRRAEVAKLLQITREGVRHHEQSGKLNPVLVGGEWRFDPLEIDRYVKARAARLLDNTQNRELKRGEIAAHAFAMLEKGATRREVVLKLKIEPEYAQRLWRQYQPETFEQAERKRTEAEEQEQKDQERKDRVARTREILGRLNGASTTPTPRR